MIIFHNRTFIFIHCREAAGRSMKVAIAPYLSGDDIFIDRAAHYTPEGRKRVEHLFAPEMKTFAYAWPF